jgi:inhibitor of KinA
MRIVPLGDSALLVELSDRIDAVTNARVRAAFAAVASAGIPGVIDLVPGYTSLAVHYDPASFRRGDDPPHETAASVVRGLLSDLHAVSLQPGPVHEIRVRYGGEYGPDIEHVARHTGLSTASVIDLHTSAEYRVYVIGFTPGFPYLGGLPPGLATPRRASPRQAVPAGSVGIAGTQTGIYPLRTPGGWQIIGRTDERLFRPELDPPALLRVGDRIRFVAVDDA